MPRGGARPGSGPKARGQVTRAVTTRLTREEDVLLSRLEQVLRCNASEVLRRGLQALAATLTVLVLAGCDLWVPDEFPVKVDLPAEATEDQVESVVLAIERIERAAGYDVFELVSGNGRKIQRGRVAIRSTGMTIDAAKARHYHVSVAHTNHWSCKVYLATDAIPELATHELMHCLGIEHDDIPGSIMGEVAGRTIREGHVEHIRALAGLPMSDYSTTD